MTVAEENADANTASQANAWLPYVVPFGVFTVFTALIEPQFRSQYATVYVAKVVLVTASLLWFRSPWRGVRLDGKALALSALIGLALCAVWVGGEKLIPYPHPEFLGGRAHFNPFKEIADPVHRAFFIAVRLFGLSVLVAAVEEIFYRAFLLRYLTDPDFDRLPLGAFSWSAASIAAAIFGLAHPEWLSAVIFAYAMALLLRRTRSLLACFVAHGVANLALGIYVLTTGEWQFW